MASIQASKIHILGQKVNIFSYLRVPVCIGEPILSNLISTYSNQGKKLGILIRYLQLLQFEGQNFEIAISPRYSKSMRQISGIMHKNIIIFDRNPQEMRGSGGNGFFLTALKITFWPILTWKAWRFKKFLFLWITYGLYHNGPQ